MNVKRDLECIIMSFGEPTYPYCLESIKSQTYQPARILNIEGISPINESINKRHESMRLPFSVKVDTDMVLHDNCFEILYKALKCEIKAGKKKYYAVTGMLLDPFIGKIGAVHMERTALVNKIVVPDIIGCDRFVREKLMVKGYHILEIKDIVGEHWCDWSPEAIFKRHVRVGQKHFYYRDKHHEDWVRNIGLLWSSNNSGSAFLALLGYCFGLLTPDQYEKDGSRFMVEEFEAVEELIRDGVVPEPKQLWSLREKL